MSTAPESPGDEPLAGPGASNGAAVPSHEVALTPQQAMAALADVQIAHEELRVAEEEMRVQQEQITQLLLQHDAERRWRGQVSALVPVGLGVTDGNGLLVEANPALAEQLGTVLTRLRGKPLSVYLAPEDVRQFRSALRALTAGTVSEQRLSVTMRSRDGTSRSTHVFGFPENASGRPSTTRLQWVVVPEEPFSGDADEAPPSGTAEVGAGADGPVDDGEPRLAAAEVIGLATSLSELSSLPVGEYDRQRLLGRMAALVRASVPGAEWVSITLGSPIDPQRLGSDSSEAQDFDGRQLQAGEGPCLTAYTSGSVVVSDDVTADVRWPALGRRSGAVRSVLAVPVQEDGQTIGAVNAYSSRVGAFGGAGRRIAEVATAAVASVLRTVAERESMEKLAEGLERALTSRAVIDQAKGVIMARLGVDADNAFARLVQVSSRLNVKVRDLAALVVEGHVEAVLRVEE